MARKKWQLHGYYFDGKKSWIMYIDEDGNIMRRRRNGSTTKMKEMQYRDTKASQLRRRNYNFAGKS
mgnify:CR=1 FL=1